MVFLRLMLMTCFHNSFPFRTSCSFLTWCTSKYPPSLPQYSHCLARSRCVISVLERVNLRVVLENSNVAKLASSRYLAVHSLPQEDCYDTNDASRREIYAILVPESTLC